MDYDGSTHNGNPADEFNMWTPLGNLPDNVQPPIRPVNYIIIEPNEAEGRNKVSYIFTAQVYNLDGSFAVFHFGGFFDVDNPGDALESLLKVTGGGYYGLPRYYSDPNVLHLMNMFNFWSYVSQVNRKIDSNGYSTVIKPLVEEWLDSGKVPAELEEIVFLGSYKRWKY